MTIILYVLLLITVIALFLVSGIRIARTSISRFELNARIARGDESAKYIVRREKFISDLQSLQKVVIAVLVVVIVIFAIAASGWLMGSIVAIVIALEFGFISHRSFIHGIAQRLYDTHEPNLLSFLEKHQWAVAPFRHWSDAATTDVTIHSKQEYLSITAQTNVLTEAEKQSIQSILHIENMTVGDSMVPFKNVVTVTDKELLGPLVLNDLHGSGQSRFPVIDHKGTVVGILDIRQMLTIDAGKHSTTASKAMNPSVITISPDATILSAMQVFAREQCGLLLVADAGKQLGFIDPITITETALGRPLS